MSLKEDSKGIIENQIGEIDYLLDELQIYKNSESLMGLIEIVGKMNACLMVLGTVIQGEVKELERQQADDLH